MSPREDDSRRSWILLLVGWLGTFAAFGGVVLWLQLSAESTLAELQAMQPRATVSVSANAAQKVPPAAPVPSHPSPDGQVDPAVGAPAGGPPAKSSAPAAPQSEVAAGLHPHPDPQLIQQSKLGPLPIIGADGREPWQVYARPFSTLDKRPRIALVMTRMGISADATESAVQDLPAPITLAFAPFARRLDEWINRARGAGHEVMVTLPMEPLDYPRNDPGPYALLTSISAEQNLRRLDWVLSRVTGYVGVTNFMGSKFTTDEAALRPILAELKKRGLMFLDSRRNPQTAVPKMAAGLHLVHVVSDVVIDREPSREDIDSGLAELERIASTNGAAVGIGHPYPVTLERVRRWSQEIAEKGFVLAPVSAMGQPTDRR